MFVAEMDAGDGLRRAPTEAQVLACESGIAEMPRAVAGAYRARRDHRTHVTVAVRATLRDAAAAPSCESWSRAYRPAPAGTFALRRQDCPSSRRGGAGGGRGRGVVAARSPR